MEEIRDRFSAPVHVNDWYRGGHLKERGFRLPGTKTGAKYSQHKFGRACDFNIPGLTIEEIYDDILRNEKIYLDFGVTTIEDVSFTKTWIHLDTRWTGMDKIKIVKP